MSLISKLLSNQIIKLIKYIITLFDELCSHIHCVTFSMICQSPFKVISQMSFDNDHELIFIFGL